MCQTCHVERDFQDWAPLCDIARARAEKEKVANANARFSLFSELPTELRFRIWRIAEDALDSRVFTITGKAAHLRWPTPKSFWYMVSVSCGPTLLHVNQEARYELIGRYMKPFSTEKCFPSIEKTLPVTGLLINPCKDVPFLCFVVNELYPRRRPIGHVKTFLKGVFGDNFTQATEKLRNIAIEWEGHIGDVWEGVLGSENVKWESDLGDFPPFLPKLEHVFVTDYTEMYHFRERGIRVVRFPMPPYHFDTRRIMQAAELRTGYHTNEQIFCKNPYVAIKPPKFRMADVNNPGKYICWIWGDPHYENYGIHGELELARKGQVLSRDETLAELSVHFNSKLSRLRKAREKCLMKNAKGQAIEAKKAKKALRKAAREAKRKDILDFLVPSWFDEE